ncbi:hypothetical protein ACJX0J_026770, partial [Zea mays]
MAHTDVIIFTIDIFCATNLKEIHGRVHMIFIYLFFQETNPRGNTILITMINFLILTQNNTLLDSHIQEYKIHPALQIVITSSIGVLPYHRDLRRRQKIKKMT